MPRNMEYRRRRRRPSRVSKRSPAGGIAGRMIRRRAQREAQMKRKRSARKPVPRVGARMKEYRAAVAARARAAALRKRVRQNAAAQNRTRARGRGQTHTPRSNPRSPAGRDYRGPNNIRYNLR